MATTDQDRPTAPSRKWVMLALGMLAQTASAVFINGAAFLIPALHDDRGLALAGAGLLVAMPTVGIMLTLIAWGVLVDRIGERLVLVTGLGLTALASAAAYFTTSFVLLGLALLAGGMAAASANSASGRVVVGWFPPHRRGLAMGIRQMSVPLGVAIAALTIPTIARDHGVSAALAVPALVCTLAAILCLAVVDPPRPSRAAALEQGLLANPYKAGSQLWRIHSTSILLVVPQYVVWTYALVWLMTDREWSAASAGILVTATQILGALGRMSVGALSDRVGSRMRPLRWVAVGASFSMFGLALTDYFDSPVSIAFLVLASVMTVAPNGLAFTAVAEFRGRTGVAEPSVCRTPASTSPHRSSHRRSALWPPSASPWHSSFLRYFPRCPFLSFRTITRPPPEPSEWYYTRKPLSTGVEGGFRGEILG